jgi:aldehyde:ferredoxin oxidoreductase
MGMVLTGEDWADVIQTLLGDEFTEKDVHITGERIYNLERIYNIREGLTRADDTLPKRLMEDPLPDGPGAGHVVNLEPMLSAYYQYRGWDQDGRPTNETLTRLGLNSFIGKF